MSLSIEIQWPLLHASYATYAVRFGSAESTKSVRSPAPLHATDAFSRTTRNGPVRELEVARRYVALGYAQGRHLYARMSSPMWQQVHPQDILSSALVVDKLLSEAHSATALGSWERVSTKGPVHKVGRAADIQRVVFAKEAAPKLLVYSCAANVNAL